MSEPKRTIPEQLDAAQSGKEFANALNAFFAAVEREVRYRQVFEEEADDE